MRSYSKGRGSSVVVIVTMLFPVLGCGDTVPAAPGTIERIDDVLAPETPDAGPTPGTGAPPGSGLMGCTGARTRFAAAGDNNGGTEPGIDFDVLLPFPVELTTADAEFSASVSEDRSVVRAGAFREGEFSEQVGVSVFLGTGDGSPLELRTYEVDEREQDSMLSIRADAPWYPAGVDSCDTTCGSFRVIDLDVVGGEVNRLVATFEQFCRCEDEAAYRGCISFIR
ncbi:MAG: hypothetical protein AAF436_15450 [Myxococcota bacterium]